MTSEDPAAVGRPGARLRRDALVAVGGRGLTGLLTFGSVLLATRLLDPAAYGELALLIATSVVIYALVASWTVAPIYTLAAEELTTTGSLHRTSTARLLILLFTMVLAWVVLVVVVLAGVVASVGGGFVLACAAIGTASAWCEHATTLLETSAHYAAAALVQVVRPAAYVAALGGLLAAQGDTADLGQVVVALSASWAMTCLISAALALRTVPMRPVRTSWLDVRRLWRAAWPLTLFSVSQLLFGTVDLYFVRIFAEPEDVGHYGLAYQAFGMGAVLASAVPALVAPRLTRARAEGHDAITPYLRAVGRTALPLAAAALSVGVPLVPLLVPAFFGDAYDASAEPLVVLTVALLLLVGASLLGPILLVDGATSVIGRTAVIAVGVNIVLDVVLLGWWDTGIIGPAIATTVACGVTFLAYSREVSRRAEAPVANSVVVVVPVAVAVGATLLLPVQFAVPLAVATAAVFLGALRLTGRVDLPARR